MIMRSFVFVIALFFTSCSLVKNNSISNFDKECVKNFKIDLKTCFASLDEKVYLEKDTIFINKFGNNISYYDEFQLEDSVKYVSFYVKQYDCDFGIDFRYLALNHNIIKLKIDFFNDSDIKLDKILYDLKESIFINNSILKKHSFEFVNSSEFQKFYVVPLKKHNHKYLENFNVLTDPLIKYDFGGYCYYEGIQPKGAKAVEYFIKRKDIYSLKEILKGYNPEGRLYAAEALLKLAYKYQKIVLSEDIKILINQIINSNIKINVCSGCRTSSLTVKEIIDDEMIEKEYLELLK